jgi:hypothetical protein
MPGRSGGFGPQDALAGDAGRGFWVPLHKLFSGRECIAGLDLQIALSSGLRNDLLASFHRFLEFQGFRNNYYGDALKDYPFTIENSRIAGLSSRGEYGPGVLVPHPEPFILPAMFHGRPLTFPVDPAFTGEPENIQMSSPMVLPDLTGTINEPNYLDDAAQETRRPAPQYINARHAVENGRVVNLNDSPDLMKILARGDFDALHYVDTSGDGWVIAECPQLRQTGLTGVAAFCMVGLPDFLPNVTQRDLMLWWRRDVPEPLRAALWAIPPFALSQTRIAADIELPVGFSIKDDTVTAIVSQPDRIVVAYRNVLYVDYIDMPGTMTAALTARIDAPEYKARILALAAVYWSLGIRPSRIPSLAG